MEIGIVIHSKTGNTEYVANKLKEMLIKKGHIINYKKLQLLSNKKAIKNIRFKEIPELESYDTIIFGSHVEAFSLANEMKVCLESIEQIKDKKAVCLITQGLPFKWMGANKALKQMNNFLEDKGANVIINESISWSNKKKREKKIIEAVERINKLF